jgi:choloylglycine hydrolase
MKKGVAALAAAFMLAVPAAEACTRLVYHGHDGAVITARSMDWKDEIMTNLWIFRAAWRGTGPAARTP